MKAGERVDRYTLREPQPAPAAIERWLADDAQLGRSVVIDLLGGTPEERGRLLGRARALAGASHPSLIKVFDAGERGEHIFLVGERFEGEPADRWLRTPRSWTQVLAAFVAAGRGLAAAHAAGVVHGALGAEQVLIGGGSDARITGYLPGGDPADAGDDQRDFAALLRQALGGRGPAALRRVLDRAGSREPAERWPSLAALLDALVAVPRRRRAAVLAAGGGVLAAGAVATLLLAPRPQQPVAAPPPCQGAGDLIAQVWSPPRRDAVRGIFAASERAHARDTFERVAVRIDAYAADWVAERTRACEDTRVRAAQPEAVMDLRVHCLDQRRAALAALIDRFTGKPDPKVIDKAMQAAASLQDLAACGDVTALTAAVPPPADPALAARVEALRPRLEQARALYHTGGFGEGLAVSERLLADARATGHAPFVIEVLIWHGRLLEWNDRPEDARKIFREGIDLAARVGDDRGTAELWLQLVENASNRGAPDEEESLLAPAQAALLRAGKPADQEAALEGITGNLRMDQGKPDEALAHFQRARELFTRAFGADSHRTANAIHMIGSIRQAKGDDDGARAAWEEAVGIYERALGAKHPLVAGPLNGLGHLAMHDGDLERAEQLFSRALDIAGGGSGPEQLNAAVMISNLGIIAVKRGDLATARKRFTQVLDIRTPRLPPEHPSIARALANLATVDGKEGKHTEARAGFERAVAILEKKLGPDHPELGEARYGLARATWDSGGDRRAAVDLARRARKNFAAGGAEGVEKIGEVDAWLAAHRP